MARRVISRHELVPVNVGNWMYDSKTESEDVAITSILYRYSDKIAVLDFYDLKIEVVPVGEFIRAENYIADRYVGGYNYIRLRNEQLIRWMFETELSDVIVDMDRTVVQDFWGLDINVGDFVLKKMPVTIRYRRKSRLACWRDIASAVVDIEDKTVVVKSGDSLWRLFRSKAIDFVFFGYAYRDNDFMVVNYYTAPTDITFSVYYDLKSEKFAGFCVFKGINSCEILLKNYYLKDKAKNVLRLY